MEENIIAAYVDVVIENTIIRTPESEQIILDDKKMVLEKFGKIIIEMLADSSERSKIINTYISRFFELQVQYPLNTERNREEAKQFVRDQIELHYLCPDYVDSVLEMVS